MVSADCNDSVGGRGRFALSGLGNDPLVCCAAASNCPHSLRAAGDDARTERAKVVRPWRTGTTTKLGWQPGPRVEPTIALGKMRGSGFAIQISERTKRTVFGTMTKRSMRAFTSRCSLYPPGRAKLNNQVVWMTNGCPTVLEFRRSELNTNMRTIPLCCFQLRGGTRLATARFRWQIVLSSLLLKRRTR